MTEVDLRRQIEAPTASTGIANAKAETPDAYLWYVKPDSQALLPMIPTYEALLSEEEHGRYQRLTRESVRHEYLLTRALVRTVLSRHALNDPREWRFACNAFGKPEIVPAPGLPPLRFSLTHTTGLIACLVALDRDVGIDAEDLARTDVTLDLAGYACSQEEQAELGTHPPDRQRDRLLEYWTLKEAYAKARGLGMSLPFHQFSFRLAPDRPPAIAFHTDLEDDPATWQFAQPCLSPRHLVAVAVRRRDPADVAIELRETYPLYY